EKVTVAPSGVDLRAFHPAQHFPERGEILRTLFVGRIDPNKGPDIAADAVGALRKEGLPVDLTVAGGLWFYRSGDESQDPFFLKLKGKMDAVSANYLGHVSRANLPAIVRE